MIYKIYSTKITICLFTISVLFASCGQVLSKAYGIKTLKQFDSLSVKQTEAELTKDYEYHFETETSSVAQFREYFQTEDSVINSLYQPVQILYFNNDTLKSFHANCYATGSLSNLNWDVDGRFESFLPKTAIPTDALKMSYSKFSSIFGMKKDERELIVAIFWTTMMKRISKSAVDAVMKNITKLDIDKDIRIILINTDHFFSEN